MIFLDPFLAFIKGGLALFSIASTLYLFDRSNGVSFSRDILPEIRRGNIGVTVYYSARFVGACLLYAAVWFVPV